MSQFISYPETTYEIRKNCISGTVYKEKIILNITDNKFKEIANSLKNNFNNILEIINTNKPEDGKFSNIKKFKQLCLLQDLEDICYTHNMHCITALTFEAAHLPENLSTIPNDFIIFEFKLCYCNEIDTNNYINNFSQNSNLPEILLTENNSDKYFERYNKVLEHLKSGDVYEFVLSRKLKFKTNESEIFNYLKYPILTQQANYRFAIEFQETKICGASPEILLDISGNLATMRPISGSARRTSNSKELTKEDIIELNVLMSSEKEKSELDMLIDLARNDLNKFCTQVEVSKYREPLILEHIIHTQASVTGILNGNINSIFAVLNCINAGTLVGVPKRKAMEIIFDIEEEKRNFYGGNLIHIQPNRSLKTIILIRSAFIHNEHITFQAGSSIILEADPQYEFWECGSKLKNLVSLIKKDNLCFNLNEKPKIVLNNNNIIQDKIEKNNHYLMIENFDSFSNNLVALFEKCGVKVDIISNNVESIDFSKYAGIILSPGPSHPKEAGFLIQHIKYLINKKPIFGVCLGFQAIVEAFGGEVKKLPNPVHGKAKKCLISNSEILFKNLPTNFLVGRYHSLYGNKIPEEIKIVAVDELNTPMALEVTDLENNICAVQFHPESFLTGYIGETIIKNWIESIA
ncbi:chorismate-binding protein [Pigmentibacter sp. JX0631]|uniref:chorismate-binding protein n=1 Tax=Pigmentibacter sp. JX0631 TaxID=2976982 RepID=UPI0024692EA3|nr:chorismate-binding protein [Pigmentibacter sp. JX0631]WGL59607.1 chorismate-binding protein [Pigmentibacter sp. JX0631]